MKFEINGDNVSIYPIDSKKDAHLTIKCTENHEKIKQNQKIVDAIVKTYKSLVEDGAFNDVHEVEYSIAQELENIIEEATGKDIGELK